MTTPRFIPQRSATGGSLIGNSYLATYAACPYEWFNRYLRPGPDESHVGISPKREKPFLTVGRVFHEGIAEWYRSGCRDGADTGERSVDRALDVARRTHNSAVKMELYADAEEADASWLSVETLLRSYHDRYGPTSPNPEYPEIEVVHDGLGQPLIEREFKLDLGYGGYVFTTRPDMLMLKRGYLCTRDHKTSTARYVGERLRTIDWDPQFTGEYLAIRRLFPEEPLNGAEANVLVKDRSMKSKFDIAERNTTTRSDRDLDAFAKESMDLLQRIDVAVEGFKQDYALYGPEDLERLAETWFPRHGTRTQRCGSYGGCPMLEPLCRNKDRIDVGLRHFRPREVEEVKESKERPW